MFSPFAFLFPLFRTRERELEPNYYTTTSLTLQPTLTTPGVSLSNNFPQFCAAFLVWWFITTRVSVPKLHNTAFVCHHHPSHCCLQQIFNIEDGLGYTSCGRWFITTLRADCPELITWKRIGNENLQCLGCQPGEQLLVVTDATVAAIIPCSWLLVIFEQFFFLLSPALFVRIKFFFSTSSLRQHKWICGTRRCC